MLVLFSDLGGVFNGGCKAGPPSVAMVTATSYILGCILLSREGNLFMSDTSDVVVGGGRLGIGSREKKRRKRRTSLQTSCHSVKPGGAAVRTLRGLHDQRLAVLPHSAGVERLHPRLVRAVEVEPVHRADGLGPHVHLL